MSLIIKCCFLFNITVFFLFSFFYFNKKGIKLDWRWTLLKLVTSMFWIHSSYQVLSRSLSDQYSFMGFLFLNIISSFIFFWAYANTAKLMFDNIFTSRAPEEIVVRGPYRFIRHPYYTSYLICYFSTLFFDSSLINLFFLSLIVILYFYAVKSEEKKIMESKNSDIYKSYVLKTKRFVPFLY